MAVFFILALSEALSKKGKVQSKNKDVWLFCLFCAQERPPQFSVLFFLLKKEHLTESGD